MQPLFAVQHILLSFSLNSPVKLEFELKNVHSRVNAFLSPNAHRCITLHCKCMLGLSNPACPFDAATSGLSLAHRKCGKVDDYIVLALVVSV